MSMRKRLALAAATATLGLVLGATVLSPVLAGAQESTTSTTTDESPAPAGDFEGVRVARFRVLLEDLVTEGTITSDQADAVAEHLGQFPFVGHHFRGGHIRIALDVAAATIGIDRAALINGLQAGQTIAEVASANGVEADTVIDALAAAHQERLDELVADGSITPEEAAERASEALERITDLVNGELRLRPAFGAAEERQAIFSDEA